MPSNFALHAMNTFHRGLLKVSFGRFGWSAIGMPVIELTTVGRKSGEPRRVMLTSPWQEGDTIVVVASRGGDPVHPQWYLNLLEHPEVEVVSNGEPQRKMRAHAADAEERARLWPLVTGKYQHYAGYQEKTDREIPLVLIEPFA